MIFGASATHALRALARIAANEGEEAMLGRDLAGELRVPPHYLSKVLATLARAGVLRASRGVRGGYRLARSAEEITLMEIVEPFEGKRVRPGCLLSPDRPCAERGPCSAHAAWAEVKEVSVRFLERTTLAAIKGGAAEAGERAPRTRGGPAKRRKTTNTRRSTG